MVFDWVTFGEPLSFWQMLLRIVAAVIFGAIIGIEREMKNRPAGMRTHVLVCLGAALIGLVEQQTIAHVVALGAPHINVSVGRLTAQIVSGVGFLGAGTIIIADRRISGLTTAASLWCAACLGLAVGAGFTTMALVACLVVMIVLKLMQQIVHVNTYKRLEIQFIHRNETLKYIRDTFEEMQVKILDQDFHADNTQDGQNIYTNVYTSRENTAIFGFIGKTNLASWRIQTILQILRKTRKYVIFSLSVLASPTMSTAPQKTGMTNGDGWRTIPSMAISTTAKEIANL